MNKIVNNRDLQVRKCTGYNICSNEDCINFIKQKIIEGNHKNEQQNILIFIHHAMNVKGHKYRMNVILK